MKATPMIFNTDMVLALINDQKGATRRPLKIPDGWQLRDNKLSTITSSHPKKGKWGVIIQNLTLPDFPQSNLLTAPCMPGDLIYVRETFCPDPDCDHDSWDKHELSFFEWNNCGCSAQFLPDQLKNDKFCLFKAGSDFDLKWTPSIHMPRWASRLTLKVTDVRIETLNDLRQNKEQIKKEGFENWPRFKHVWESIYGQSKPSDFVWTIEFDVIKKNIDTYLKQAS